MAGAPITRTVSIYIDQAAAEQSAERLAKKIETINRSIERNQKLGKDTAKQEAELARMRERHAEARAVADGRATASIRHMQQYVTKLRNELMNMSRDAPGWAKKFEEFKGASKRLQELEKELRDVNRAMETLNRPGFWKTLRDNFLPGAGLGLGVVAAQKLAQWLQMAVLWLKNFALAAADAAIKFEQLQTSFTTLLGSRQAANEMIKDLQRFSLATPFEFTEVAQLTKQLLAYGFAQKEIIPTLQMLGDVASGVGKEKLPNLMLAFGQIRAAGRLMGPELRQLIDAGFNPLQIISEKTGKSMGQLRKDMEAGLISFDMVKDAFQDVTAEGGRFYNMMQNQSKTTGGALAALKDSWEQFKISLGLSFNAELKDLYIHLGNIVNKFREWVGLNPAEEIAAEKVEVNGLVLQLIDAVKKGKDRNNIIAELNAKYPTLLNNMNLEKASANQLVLALQSINAQYRDRIRLASATALAEKKAKENIDKQVEIDEYKNQANSVLGKYFSEREIADMDFESMSRDRRNQIYEIIRKRGGDRDQSIFINAISNIQMMSGQLDKGLAEGEKLLAKQKKLEGELTEVNSIQNRIDALTKTRNAIANSTTIAIVASRKERLKELDSEIERLSAEKKEAEDELKKLPELTPDDNKPTDDKGTKAREKALERLKDIKDKVAALEGEVTAAALDAEAGFEDKANQQIQKVTQKYTDLINQAKELAIKAAGLTDAEKDELNNAINDYGLLMERELDTLRKKLIMEGDADAYGKELQILSDFYQQEKQKTMQHYADGLISKREYTNQLKALEVEEAQMRVDTMEAFAPYVKKAAEDLEKAKTEAVQKEITERDRLLDSQNRNELAKYQRQVLLFDELSRQQLEAKKQVLKEQFRIEQGQMQYSRETLLLKQEELNKALLSLDQEYADSWIRMIIEMLKGVSDVWSSFNELLNTKDQQELDKVKTRNEDKTDSYKRMLDNNMITQQQYDQYMDQVNTENEKKEKEIRAREAKRNKAAAYFNAVLSTAEAIANALKIAPPWLGIAMAALVGAKGAIQIATISNQKEPSYARGGVIDPKKRKGGIAKGASHAQGGIALVDSVTGQKVGEMEGNEAYMILSKKTTAANRDIIEQLLAASLRDSDERIMPKWFTTRPVQMDYGAAIEKVYYSRQYRNGGVTAQVQPPPVPTPATVKTSDEQTLHNLASALETFNKNASKPVKAYIVWTELEEKQKQIDRVKQLASFGGG